MRDQDRQKKNREIRSYDRISVASACFEGFPLCQRQDPTEEDLPFGG